jgi:hypothetical protein
MSYSPRKRSLFAAAVVCAAGLAIAADSASVPGSNARFATAIDVQAAGKSVRLNLTGTALRKKAIFSVYAVASYLQEGITAKTADQLAAADTVKLLHLIMERDVSGKDMAEALRAGVRLNYPADTFPAELSKVSQFFESTGLAKGDQILLTAVPRVGLRCQIAGKADVMIESPKFARAVWDIYLGRQNLGDSIKAGLTSRL